HDSRRGVCEKTFSYGCKGRVSCRLESSWLDCLGGRSRCGCEGNCRRLLPRFAYADPAFLSKISNRIAPSGCLCHGYSSAHLVYIRETWASLASCGPNLPRRFRR